MEIELVFRYVNIALDLMSLMICILLLIYQFFERKTKTRTDFWFTSMVVFNIGMLIGDLGDWYLGGIPGNLNFIVQYAVTIVLYFGSSGFLLFSLYGWVVSSIKQKTTVSSIWLQIGLVLSAVQLLIALTMPLTRFVYIDANNRYQRGTGFFVTQLCPYILYVLAIYLLIRYRKAFKKKELVYLAVLTTVPVVAELIQVFTYVYSILNVAISLALIVVFSFIQSQREFEREQDLREYVVDENKRLEEMQDFQENLSTQLIDALCNAVEAKDLYTQGHSLRVAQYAREIMYRLGGDEKAQQEVYCIGILHDVGKIHVKDEIINKNGRLTAEEYEQVKLHTVAGY